MESKMIIVTLFAMSCVQVFSLPASRTVDNTIYTRNMPQDLKRTMPNLVEVTKKLTNLYTSGRPMKLTADVFAGATQLEMIDLSDGDLQEIESRAFYGPSKLKKLNLSGNKLKALPRDLFPRNNAVKEINLSNNQINTLSRSTFTNLQHMKKLDMSNNQLTRLEGSIFADMIHLRELDLTGNPITSIDEEFFASLPQGLQFSFDDQSLDQNSLRLTDQWAQ